MLAGLTEPSLANARKLCDHPNCQNLAVPGELPTHCYVTGCKCELLKCVVCGEAFVTDIDDVCSKCSAETPCSECKTTGHKKLFWVERVETAPGVISGFPEGGWVCKKHFLNAYGPNFTGTKIPCTVCEKGFEYHELDNHGMCRNCATVHGHYPCLNISCNNTISPQERRGGANFCDACLVLLSTGKCTKCEKAIGVNESIDMYGHCENCRNETGTTLCKGCRKPYDPNDLPPVGKVIPELCPDCHTRVEHMVCTSCFERAEHMDEYGRCDDCSPEPQFECKGNGCVNARMAGVDSNLVTSEGKQCASCQLGYDYL